VFLDTIQVVELDDPEVTNVGIYFTDYNRSIQEKLGGDLFSDPSQSSISCVPLGNVTVKNADKIRGAEGQEIFKESKTLNLFQNKKTRIRRIYDEKRNVIIYVAFSTRNTTSSDEGGVSSSRYRTSMCAVKVDSIEQ
jgi:CreA protein